MARVVRRVALAVAAIVAILVLAVGGTAAVARLGDGPIGPFPGGPFEGAVESAPVSDWSFASELRQVEFEVNAADPRTITTWVLVEDGQLYIPCGIPESKSWPAQVLADPRTRVRADGKIYERDAQRETQPERVAALAQRLASKYETGAFRAEDVWFFRLDPRSGS
jgi:hypothetical protein